MRLTSHRHGPKGEDLEGFRPKRHLAADPAVSLIPFGNGERVCLGKALAELEIQLLAVGRLKTMTCSSRIRI